MASLELPVTATRISNPVTAIPLIASGSANNQYDASLSPVVPTADVQVAVGRSTPNQSLSPQSVTGKARVGATTSIAVSLPVSSISFVSGQAVADGSEEDTNSDDNSFSRPRKVSRFTNKIEETVGGEEDNDSVQDDGFNDIVSIHSGPLLSQAQLQIELSEYININNYDTYMVLYEGTIRSFEQIYKGISSKPPRIDAQELRMCQKKLHYLCMRQHPIETNTIRWRTAANDGLLAKAVEDCLKKYLHLEGLSLSINEINNSTNLEFMSTKSQAYQPPDEYIKTEPFSFH